MPSHQNNFLPSDPSQLCFVFKLWPCLRLQVWDVRSKTLKMDLPGHADEVYAVDWSPDGAMVASGGKDRVRISA